MSYRRGDVVLVLFPESNLRTSKRRPAVVVQADRLGVDLPQTIVAMITSNMARAGIGLLTDSVVMTDNLATIRASRRQLKVLI
jgi:mRNA interferase MazF